MEGDHRGDGNRFQQEDIRGRRGGRCRSESTVSGPLGASKELHRGGKSFVGGKRPGGAFSGRPEFFLLRCTGRLGSKKEGGGGNLSNGANHINKGASSFRAT